ATYAMRARGSRGAAQGGWSRWHGSRTTSGSVRRGPLATEASGQDPPETAMGALPYAGCWIGGLSPGWGTPPLALEPGWVAGVAAGDRPGKLVAATSANTPVNTV